MKLGVTNEFGTLKSVVVCWGENIIPYEAYQSDDPEFIKYHPHSWDKDLLLKQQENFFEMLEQYGAKLIFPKTSNHLTWQMYTRDTAFVVGDVLYYSSSRKFKERKGEIENLLNTLNLPADKVVSLAGEAEGGDALVVSSDLIYLGHGSRTSLKASEELNRNLEVKVFELGNKVMHLDTRLAILPNNIALICPSAFDKKSLDYLNKKYQLIEVTEKEAKKLGTNVFTVNPETVFVPSQHSRIGKEIEQKGLKIELIDYTEPINLGGSFRCTTLPLERA